MGWLSLHSMRTLATVDGVTRIPVLRRITHALAAVKDRAPSCDTCG